MKKRNEYLAGFLEKVSVAFLIAAVVRENTMTERARVLHLRDCRSSNWILPHQRRRGRRPAMIDADTMEIFVLSAILIGLVGGFGVWEKHRSRKR